MPGHARLPQNGERGLNSNYRFSASPPIHPVAGSILRTGMPEPLIKLPCLKMATASLKRADRKQGIKMKTTIVLVALICAVGAFAERPSSEIPRQAAAEPLAPLAMMQAPHWLPTEAYDAN